MRFPDFVRTFMVIFLKPEPLLNTVNGLIGQRVTARPNLRVGSILTSDLTACVPALPSLLEYVIDIGMLFEIEMNS